MTARGGAILARLARRLRPARRRGRALPVLWLVSDPVRLPDPRAAAARLPRGAGVLARGLAAPVLAGLAGVARQRGLRLLIGGDGRAALRHHAGLHLPERRAGRGLLPFLLARRRGVPFAALTLSAHGAAAATARARRCGADLAFLSPAFATASHPGAPGLGPHRWARLARALPCPAVALGGIATATAARLPRHAAGLAAIGGLAGGLGVAGRATPCGGPATVFQ